MMRAGFLALVSGSLLVIVSLATQLTGADRAAPASAAPNSTLPDLSIGMAILGNPSTVTPGQSIPYAFVVTNEGGAMPAGSRVLVADELPGEVTFLSAMEGARAQIPFYLGVVCTYNEPVVSCELPEPLAPGDHFVVRIDVQLSASATAGNLINQVRVDPLGEITESNENNNKSKVKVQIQP